ncbi:MAG: 2-dehydropantoate 2-reductase [Phycisphaeraceae bacterium]|nr:2-dehydropantoate 2-reductase [Phycisphaeraceae bacterium]
MNHPRTIERVGVIGAGAIGTVLAALLGRVVPTVVVCRNPVRAGQLFAHGAVCRGGLEAASRPIIVRTVADLCAVGGVAAVFVTTKTTAIADIAADLAPMCSGANGPVIVSCQNGIDPGRQLAERLPGGRVARMVLNLGATCDAGSGETKVTLNAPPHAIGSPDARLGDPCERLAAILSGAGLETCAAPDIEARVWAKSLMNAAVNPVAALCNMTVGEVMASPARPIVDRLLHEGFEVACAEGIDLGTGYLERAAATLSRAADHTPSMVEDVRSGRESEIGQLNRPIMDRGAARGVPTPTHEVVDSLIEALDWAVSGRGSGGFAVRSRPR